MGTNDRKKAAHLQASGYGQQNDQNKSCCLHFRFSVHHLHRLFVDLIAITKYTVEMVPMTASVKATSAAPTTM